jgi:ubiquinone/menaquinone biosynthesis C-methylase UbiE
MSEHSHDTHEHAGLTSKGFLSTKKILSEVGLKEGQTFLDAGCGAGHFSIAASKQVGTKGTIYAVDIDHHAISSLKDEIAKKDLINIETVISDLTKHIPVNDSSIDVCLLANVMHGFAANKEVGSVFSEITRIMKPKGILVVVDFKKKFSLGPPKSIRLSPEEMEALITPLGFEIIKTVNVGLFHYLIMFHKE